MEDDFYIGDILYHNSLVGMRHKLGGWLYHNDKKESSERGRRPHIIVDTVNNRQNTVRIFTKGWANCAVVSFNYIKEKYHRKRYLILETLDKNYDTY